LGAGPLGSGPPWVEVGVFPVMDWGSAIAQASNNSPGEGGQARHSHKKWVGVSQAWLAARAQFTVTVVSKH
jgi:hypothetical protein